MEPLPEKAHELAEPLLDSGLCDACLGRTVARLGYGLTNTRRGRDLRGGPRIDPADCTLCAGLSGQADRVAELALAAADGIEHATFQLGCRVDDDIEAAEESLRAEHGLASTGEPLRSQLTREAGKRYEAGSEASFDPEAPELTLVVDTRFWTVETEIAPRVLTGRYRKLERGIPQTRWHCRRCRGRGCVDCDMTGKRYPTSVEELVGGPARAAFRAREAILHGQGREDVDARMLGTGRPFALELKRPRRRDVDLEALTEAVREAADGRVEVQDLAFAGSEAVQEVKQRRSEKTYRARIAFSAPVEGENLKEATTVLAGASIRQHTPSRVAHRRADRVRTRDVHRFDVEAHDEASGTVVLRGDAGLYVKELISGDGGRTSPSLAELLGVDAEVVELDVVAVED